MSEPRVIQADYANWRPVQGRKVLQLIFEVPIEQTADVMNKLGTPTSGESRWCAIALLDKTRAVSNGATVAGSTDHLNGHEPDRNDSGGGNPSKVVTAGETAHRKFSELPLPQQAGIRCQDRDFQWFLMDKYPVIAANNTETKGAVCVICGVITRSELTHGEASGDKWLALEERYQAWRTDRQFAGARR